MDITTTNNNNNIYNIDKLSLSLALYLYISLSALPTYLFFMCLPCPLSINSMTNKQGDTSFIHVLTQNNDSWYYAWYVRLAPTMPSQNY